MTLGLGYAISTLIFLAFFDVMLTQQVRSKEYHPVFYWLVIIAMTNVGTTPFNYFDCALELGYFKASIIPPPQAKRRGPKVRRIQFPLLSNLRVQEFG